MNNFLNLVSIIDYVIDVNDDSFETIDVALAYGDITSDHARGPYTVHEPRSHTRKDWIGYE